VTRSHGTWQIPRSTKIKVAICTKRSRAAHICDIWRGGQIVSTTQILDLTLPVLLFAHELVDVVIHIANLVLSKTSVLNRTDSLADFSN
jgi:hypothetical protein